MATYELGDALELGLGEGEAPVPVWRAAYPEGEAAEDHEAEAFFESLAEYAIGPGGGRGATAGVGRAAARAALAPAGTVGVPLGSLALPLGDEPAIVEGEWELEGLDDGASAAMVMEHLGHAATLAESEAEAEAFILPLLPLATKALLPKVASFATKRVLPTVMKQVLPRVTQGAVQVARHLRQDPATRQLVRTLPAIARRTVVDIARQVEQGRPITPELATRYLARETQRVLADPRRSVRAYHRSRALDRRYHHACGHHHRHREAWTP